MNEKYILTKSKFCKGLQCPKILWMDMNMPEKASQNLPENVLLNGTKVGELAREFFGKCTLVEYDFSKDVMVEQTKEYLKQGCGIIAEASFLTDGLFCNVDILRKMPIGYDIVEVKSSTQISSIYIDDIAFQYYVLTKAGIQINRAYIMYINNHYVKRGAIDLQELFILEDCTDEAKNRLNKVEANVKSILAYIQSDSEPGKDIDVCCEEPYECAYREFCSRHLPEQSVFDIRRLSKKTKYAYYHDGIISYEDVIFKKPKLSQSQLNQVETAFYHKSDVVDKGKIKEFLNTLSYPLYHLDFETYQLAIPEFDGTSPYEQIPFQYSLHIEYEDGHLEHREFLAKEGTDPRRKLAESLIGDIPMDVCVLAYNMTFERGVIKRLAGQFPDLAQPLMNIRESIQDLMIPFQKQYYYTEAMQGSYSIKYVLPALWPDEPSLDYHNLEGIHKGDEASAAFADLPNHTPKEIVSIRENLLKYCGLDTFAMVKVLEKLREAVDKDEK
ncbi:MAG: DUF2779 domain-containing protein [Clostridium sp.]|nr:DUF2779 domain-containing protein [Clostridium sp.]